MITDPMSLFRRDFLDLRDVIKERDMIDPEEADEDEQEFLDAVQELEDQMWTDLDEIARNEPTMIAEHYFPEYAEEFAYDIGAVSRDANWPVNQIDWKQAAEELKMDYTEYEVAGYTFLLRGY